MRPITATTPAAIAIQPATEALNGYPPEGRLKKTGYEARLSLRKCSPGTLPTTTVTVALPNALGGRLRFLNVTLFVSCGLMVTCTVGTGFSTCLLKTRTPS